jgi:methylisocitrate lyase
MSRSALATARPDARAKREALRAWLSSGRLLRMPGAFSPLVAMAVEQAGFEGVYVSGAALAADLGLPDVGLTTLTEVAGRGGQIARATALPTLIDADTGFGEPMNVARTVQALEDAGLAGCHLEDQENPKRCGHLDHKTLVDEQTMARRIRAAVDARRDPDFVICARSDARASEGLEATIRRLRRYVDAGADMVFPEALAGAHELAAVRAAVDAPLLANMTEFGKSELLDVAALESAGVNVVIYPVTTLRLAMGAVERGLEAVAADGTQAGVVGLMQTRSRLYELLGYAEYAAFDADVFNFILTGSGR